MIRLAQLDTPLHDGILILSWKSTVVTFHREWHWALDLSAAVIFIIIMVLPFEPSLAAVHALLGVFRCCPVIVPAVA